ncbi:hypothetical protein METBIDRAFT_42560 [Metschnikowia bicuspidata var. bicuspidata NRRL YB-4993]|uniref:Uncharacterized protein n=1 Tax=Metschnikowia bicuspidata var. bicuspidata NRRL YB-4993 TaxID=869754 RepID=A0A1A0HBI0_9ASCO|nr:hypothetical protein METBIDRAFT_42560 [Metschnikowia bicuspidata var. bicuspidata NRRL YB-4993]OBA21243.1 hypothetical protein METBIDRAFT_42560 [Metschnikowia bicuspidata var. bicuspidata NRRL YB-4993]
MDLFSVLVNFQGRLSDFIIYTFRKKIAAPQFRIWSPTTLLGAALCSLTSVDRTGNSASCMVWPQPKDFLKVELII